MGEFDLAIGAVTAQDTDTDTDINKPQQPANPRAHALQPFRLVVVVLLAKS